MALTVAASGTITTTAAEQTLNAASLTAAGVYALTLNTTNMVNGDAIRVRVKCKHLTGGAETVVFDVPYANAQGEPYKFSEPVPSPYSISFTILRTAGTDRAFEWTILTY